MSRVISALAVLLLAVVPSSPVTLVASTATTSLTLVSQGSDGKPATADSGQAALSADGTATAFDSTAVLPTSAAVPQSPSPTQDTARHRRVYVRDRLAGRTTLVSDGGLGDATAPALSATGRLVAYEANDARNGENEIDVVDRQALRRARVTGNTGDPRYQRIGACPFTDEAAGLGRCGPRLSADGSTLAYPALLSPVSPGLQISTPGERQEGTRSVDANLIDLVPAGELAGFGIFQVAVTYTNTGDLPIDFTAAPAATAPFRITETTCGQPGAQRLAPADSCAVDVEFDAGGNCPDNGTMTVESGELTTAATNPDGQTGVELVAACAPFTFSTGTPEFAAPQVTAPAAAAPAAVTPECAPPPTGLPLAAAPPLDDSPADNQGTTVVDNGQLEVGRPELAWATVSGSGILTFTAPDCSVRLVDPTTLRPATPLPADQPPPCQQGQLLGNGGITETPTPGSCTAYFLVDPQRVATSSGLLSVDDQECFQCEQNTYVAVTGTRNVVVARHGPAFATSRGAVVSLDGHGDPVPDASQPTLSTTGRYLGFTAPVPAGTAGGQPAGGTEVWRRDTGTAATILVSCLLGAGGCRQDATASFPSISGDGTRMAFLAQPAGTAPAQVYVRETVAARTVPVSAGRGGVLGNAASSDPVISQDGSTVVFASRASNLLGPPSGVLTAYVGDLGPGTTGLVPVRKLAGSTAAVRPALDAHGRLVAFESTTALLPAVKSPVDGVYLFGRFGQLGFAPPSVSYGKLVAGVPQQTRTLTVTDTGPGPITFTGVAITGPFRLITDSCRGIVLRRGQRCVATILFVPVRAGSPAGVLTWTTADDGEPPVRTGVPIGATVVEPTSPLLTVSPPIADSGKVVRATGVAFPAGVVALRWSAGLGATTATVGPDGRFTSELVIFPDDMLGRRTLLAVDSHGTVLASTPFLAVPSPEEPPFHRAGS